MEALLQHLITVVLPVFLCALCGYGIAVARLPFDTKVVTTIVTYVALPALLISHLAAQHVEFADMAVMTAAAALFLTAIGLISAGILWSLGLSVRLFTGAMMLANVGNIGLSVSALAYGQQGLAYAMAFYVVVVAAIFTVGEWLPGGSMGIAALARSPTTFAVAIGVSMMALDIRLPKVFGNTLTLLGGASIPLMLLTLGYTIASLKLENLRTGFLLSLVHLVVVAGVAAVLVRLFQFSGTARGVFILQSLMPCSVFSYLMIMKYKPEHGPDVASLILLSTLFSIAVLPMALAFWI